MKRVLIVDDDEGIRKMLSILLKTWGHSVVEAKSGNEAVALLKQNQNGFNAVVSDFNMPNGSGWEVLASVEKKEGQLYIPVIILSGDFFTDSGLRIKKDLEEQGARCFPKPLDSRDIGKLQKILAKVE